jgi:SWI/SNF-related matrix-associated actin-dependent regulator 1 of chromatin subfamily A
MTRHFKSFSSMAEVLDNPMPIPFTELAEYRLEQARAKLPHAIEFISNLIEEVGKVVVFAYHREILEALHEAFASSVMVYGGMTDKQKNASVESFQNGNSQVFIGQITAAGTGLTLTASSTVVFVELDWVPGNVIQAEDRCHRLGQTDTVHAIHLVVKDSIDACMVQALVRKQNIIEEVVNA